MPGHFEKTFGGMLSPELVAQIDQQLQNVPEQEIATAFLQMEQVLLAKSSAGSEQLVSLVPPTGANNVPSI
jgi:hypothetical protein